MRKIELLRRKIAGDTPPRGDEMTRKILEVAAELFARQGYGTTTLDQIITSCGVGRDTVYRRFSAKLDLFLAVVRYVRADVAHRFDAFSVNMADLPLDRIKATMRWLLDVNLEPRLIAFQRIAFSEAAVTGKAIDDGSDRITSFLLDAIREGQEVGVLAANDPSTICAFMINALVLGPLTRAMLGDELVLDIRERNALFESTWAITVAGIGTRQGK